ncbi:hypothetical protein A3767_20805 [Oleiphilus sp. HI0133]|nr:hypothetical protein A3767_20805 [Oleiphilus sp. HI0133]
MCQRVLHGRGKRYEALERINIEWYPPYLFVQNFGDALPEQLRIALEHVFDALDTVEAILIQSREWPDFVTSVFASRNPLELPLIFPGMIDDGLHCEIKLGKNRNTGVFLDMRAGWFWVKAHSHNKRVLNLFSYTGVFSLFALHGGARRVDNVDMAANVLKIAQKNHQSNQLHDGCSAFYKRDILKAQRWFESREPYDLIILDPPPYQKKAFQGWKDYLKLLDHSRHALAEDGTMLCCLNNPQISIDEFKHDLSQHFGDHADLEVIERAPEIEELDNSKGLKLIAVRP